MTRRRDRVGFAVVLTAIIGLLVENGTSSSPWLFVDPWGLLFVLPLYGLHVLVLARVVLVARRPGLPLLYVAGALLGLYEAYVTKVLWSPTWGPTDGAMVVGLHVFQTAVLVLFVHPVLAFIAPLLVAETHLLDAPGQRGGSGLLAGMPPRLAGMPPRLAAALRSPRGSVWAAGLFTLVLAAHHAAVPGGPGVVAASALVNTVVVAVLVWWWKRRYAARPLPSLREILPGRAATGWLAGALGVLYVASGVLVRPEALPRTPGPHLVLAAAYAALIGMLVRLTRTGRGGQQDPLNHPGPGSPAPTPEPTPEPDADEPSRRTVGHRSALAVFAVGYPLVSAALAAVPPAAETIVVLSWLVAIPFGAWQLVIAARLSVTS